MQQWKNLKEITDINNGFKRRKYPKIKVEKLAKYNGKESTFNHLI